MEGMSKMYNASNIYSCPYYANWPMYNPAHMYPAPKMYQCPYYANTPICSPEFCKHGGAPIILKDYGPNPFVVNIEEATKINNYFRIALWTGNHLQLTLMSINAGEDIGLEMHPNLDQFIRIEQGQGLVMMGNTPDRLDYRANVRDDFAFIIPAGKWHNLINTGCVPLKLYSIYAPPQHPFGTVHKTKKDAEESHG